MMANESTNPAAPKAYTDPLERDEVMRGSQFRASVATAAMGLVQAGVYEGEMKVSPQAAVEAATAVLQLIHCKTSMRLITESVAKGLNIENAYNHIVNRSPEKI